MSFHEVFLTSKMPNSLEAVHFRLLRMTRSIAHPSELENPTDGSRLLSVNTIIVLLVELCEGQSLGT